MWYGKINYNNKYNKYCMKHINDFIRSFSDAGLYPNFRGIAAAGTKTEVLVEGKSVIMFASNNYLSYANDPRVIGAAIESLEKDGLGPGGSRFLCGNIETVLNLEKALADFVGVEDVITFPTGYMANMAAISILVGEFINGQPHNFLDAIVYSDENNHATLVDGIKFSGVKKVIYPHLDHAYLEKQLQLHNQQHPKLIVTESVYSMDGNLNNVSEVVRIAKKYGAMVMVDDAHGVGILGEHGGGVLKHFQLKNEVDLLMGSCDKALAGLGGYLGGSRELIKYARIAARPYLFSSTVPAAIAGGITKVIELSIKENRQLQLMEKANYLRERILKAGFTIMGNYKLPVLPILIGEEDQCKKVSEFLLEKGIYAPAVIWPAVKQGVARLRVTVMHDHSKEQLDKLVSVLIEAKKYI